MTSHYIKWCGNIQSEPCHYYSILITQHRELPEIVRNKQSHHKNDDIFVGFNGFYDLFNVHRRYSIRLNLRLRKRHFVYCTKIVV